MGHLWRHAPWAARPLASRSSCARRWLATNLLRSSYSPEMMVNNTTSQWVAAACVGDDGGAETAVAMVVAMVAARVAVKAEVEEGGEGGWGCAVVE